jgi:hypothetical protein
MSAIEGEDRCGDLGKRGADVDLLEPVKKHGRSPDAADDIGVPAHSSSASTGPRGSRASAPPTSGRHRRRTAPMERLRAVVLATAPAIVTPQTDPWPATPGEVVTGHRPFSESATHPQRRDPRTGG